MDHRPHCPICHKRDKLSRPDSEKSIWNCNRCGIDFDSNGLPTLKSYTDYTRRLLTEPESKYEEVKNVRCE